MRPTARRSVRALPWSLACAALGAQGALPAAEAPDGKLFEILNTPITVASLVPSTVRRSPGIVTLIRREEILASGARDLMEVLRALPEVEFASDSQGVVGIGFRSNFGHYGKVLLLVDGQEMNETQYGTTQFGWHYPVQAVDRIEIIRGPGSVLYGGYAEGAVIQVTTARGAQMGGAGGSLMLGTTAGRLERQATVTYGQAWGEAADVSLSYAGGQGLRGQGLFPAGPAVEVPVERFGQLGMNFLDVGLRWGGLEARFIRDDYLVRDFTREFLDQDNPAMTFRGDYGSLAYQARLGRWTLTPQVSRKEQIPWFYPQIGTQDSVRTVAGLHAEWAPDPGFTLSLGADSTRDRSVQYHRPPGSRETGTYQFDNRAGFLQASWNPGWLTVDLGARLDHHSVFGSVTSPRFALMHSERDWHLKLIASGAFCAPAIAELRDDPQIRPERTTTLEAELGHRLGSATYASCNLFWIRIRDPISYLDLPGIGDVFTNLPQTGSRGLELDSQTRFEDGYLKASLCFAQALTPAPGDRSAYWDTPTGHPGYHAGLPAFKASLQANLQGPGGWGMNAGWIQLGPRYGYQGFDPVPVRFAPLALVNLWATCTAPTLRKLELGFGVTTLLGSANPFIQGYGDPGLGGNPPLPGPGRAFSSRLTCNF